RSAPSLMRRRSYHEALARRAGDTDLSSEPGSSADAAGGAVGGRDEAGGRRDVAEDVSGQAGGELGVDLRQGREAAAYDDDVGVEEVDDGGEGAGEAIEPAIEGGAGVGSAVVA